MTAAAPAATAAAAKSWPSTRWPTNATNSPPGPTRRESNSTAPVTGVSGPASTSVPPTASATSPSVIVIMASSRPAGRRSPHAARSPHTHRRRQRLGQHHPVVERIHLAGHLLPALVPLAQHRDHVGGAGGLHRV